MAMSERWEVPDLEEAGERVRPSKHKSIKHNYECEIVLKDIQTDVVYPFKTKLLIGTHPKADVRIPSEKELEDIFRKKLECIENGEERERALNERMNSHRQSLRNIEGEHAVVYRYFGGVYMINLCKASHDDKPRAGEETDNAFKPQYIGPECEFCLVNIGKDYRLRIMPKVKKRYIDPIN